MNQMKNKLLSLLFVFVATQLNAQNNVGKADDHARITLAAYVPPQIEQMPEIARSMLQNKLSQIVTQNGMGGSALKERFIITANITVMSKDLTESAPPMTAFNLTVTFYIGDGIEGTKFSSTSINVKGVGENENKAYISALKNISPSNPTLQSFIETGKNRIMEYYNSKCDFILKQAQSLASQSKFDEAIFNLTAVPEVCKDCYDKCMDAIGPIYQKQIDKDCSAKLSQAKNVWAASQTVDGATNASDILSQIDPNAACFKDVKVLADQIAKRIKAIDQREWNFQLKQQQDNVDVTKATIKAARDIGVAYGNHQPKTVTTNYNIVGWW